MKNRYRIEATHLADASGRDQLVYEILSSSSGLVLALFMWGQGLNQSSVGTRKVGTLLNLAFIVDPDNVRRLDATVRHMLASAHGLPPDQRCKDLHLYGDLARYLARRQDLLGPA